MARRPDFWKFKDASAGNFMARRPDFWKFKRPRREILWPGGPTCGASRYARGWGGREKVAFAWDLARPPGTPASRSRGFLHGRTCSLAVVLSVGFAFRIWPDSAFAFRISYFVFGPTNFAFRIWSDSAFAFRISYFVFCPINFVFRIWSN